MMILENKEFDGQLGRQSNNVHYYQRQKATKGKFAIQEADELQNLSESFDQPQHDKQIKTQKKKKATKTQKVSRLGAGYTRSGLVQESRPKRATRRTVEAQNDEDGDVFDSEELFEDSFDSGEFKKSKKKMIQNQKQQKNDEDAGKLKKKGASSTPTALLNLLSNQIQTETGKPRVRAGKNRDNLLYRNLNLLMAGKQLQGAAGARQSSLKPQPSEPQKQTLEHQNYINEFQGLESLVSSGSSSLKHNLGHSSLNTLQQKISRNVMKASEKAQKLPKLWNTKRDIQLMKLHKVYGEDWEAIASEMDIPELTPQVIEERYNYRLFSEITKSRFTLKEDKIIAQHYAKVGPNWKKIKEFLPGRTESMIRNRFNSKIKKKNLYNFLKQHSLKSTDAKYYEEPYIEESTASGQAYSAEKITRKNSDPETEPGTLESVDMYGKCMVPSKKLKRNVDVQTPSKLQPAGESSEERVFISSHEEEVSNTIPVSSSFHAQLFKSAEERPAQNFECLDDFAYGPSTIEDNSHKRLSSSLREEVHPSPFMKPSRRTLEQDYWDPYNFGNDLELERKEPQDFMDFDKMVDNFIGDQPFNDLNGNYRAQQKYVDLLHFEEAETFEIREHPLAPISENPQPLLNEQFKGNMAVEEQPRAPQIQEFDQGFSQTNQPIRQEVDELATAAKFTQLQSLISHIKSIEMLFDRTKQEITKLQGRIAPK